MKKLLPYILIVIIVAQLFVPFTVGSGIKNNLVVTTNKAEASDNISVNSTIIGRSDSYLQIGVRVIWGEKGWRTSDSGVTITLLDSSDNVVESQDVVLGDVLEKDWLPNEKSNNPDAVQKGSVLFNNLKSNTIYGIRTIGLHGKSIWWQALIISATKMPAIPDISITTISSPDPLITSTLPTGDQAIKTPGASQSSMNEEALLPNCEWDHSSTWGGCIGRMFYWALFKPTSYIFGLTGRLLDVSIDYSTKDTSYRSAFVTEGWGVVRDFVNMFFIFVLLYIAFGTILSLHGVKTKEMIINIIIIGILMNFSLFASQVIIDASNILTRVFYNSQTIQVGPKVEGVVQDKRGSQGEIQLSAALVSKINPQKLILQAYKADNIQTNQLIGTSPKENNGISASTFILVVVLASIVNIVGIITFLTSSLIFITRVIGLWLAMIFAPLAFFSYTVPALQDIEMVGWKKWWPETLKMAFLAPVFIFFMYLIIKFLDTGLGLLINDDAGGLDFILGIFVPFIFIMILLTKAKDIASKMSGTLGQSITNGIKAVGGVALGGAALGTAMIGRRVIGQTMAKASRGDTLSQKFMDPSKKVDMNWAQKAGGWVGSGFGTGNGVNKIHDWTGGKLNEKQKKVGEVDHARHIMDETKKAAGLEGVEDKNLSGEDVGKMKTTFARTKQAETEAQVRKGTDVKGNALNLKDGLGNDLHHTDGSTIIGTEDYKKKKRGEVEAKYRLDNPTVGATLSAQDGKNIEDQLNKDLNEVVKATVKVKVETDFAHEKTKSEEHVNPLTRAFAGSNKGSYDVRKLSDIKSDKREGIFSKIPVALTAAVAMGVRTGIKNVGMSNGSIKVEGNFMKDLGNTISDSLKGMKVNVDLGHVGETKSSADSHAGGGH